MKKKTIAGLLAIVVITAAVIFAGCVEEETQVSAPSPAATPLLKTTPIPAPTTTSSPTMAPTPESPKLSEYEKICSKLSKINPELVQELDKLPEIKDGVSEEDLEAITDIYFLYSTSTEKDREAFQLMMNEGIKTSRKYCTPLEALLWIAYDKEFDGGYNPLKDYSLEKLLDNAWKGTTSSDNYKSEKWRSFDGVINRLNSPRLIAKYAVDNFVYDFESQERILKGEKVPMKTPKQTFTLKKGNCNEQARFALHCLLANGYAYDDFRKNEKAACCLRAYVSDDQPGVGHCTCLYKDGTDEFFVIDIGRRIGQIGIVGPFTTIEEAADATYPHSWKMYYLFNDYGKITFKTSREFEEIVPLLDTPDKVSAFMKNNIEWDGSYDLRTAGINEYVPAWLVYERGIDDCDGHATIQAYILKANGYEAWNVGIGIGRPEGHNVCVYLEGDSYWVLDNCGVKKGPFKSLDEVGDSIIPGGSIVLFDPFDITSPTKGSAFSLPHKVYRS